MNFRTYGLVFVGALSLSNCEATPEVPDSDVPRRWAHPDGNAAHPRPADGVRRHVPGPKGLEGLRQLRSPSARAPEPFRCSPTRTRATRCSKAPACPTAASSSRVIGSTRRSPRPGSSACSSSRRSSPPRSATARSRRPRRPSSFTVTTGEDNEFPRYAPRIRVVARAQAVARAFFHGRSSRRLREHRPLRRRPEQPRIDSFGRANRLERGRARRAHHARRSRDPLPRPGTLEDARARALLQRSGRGALARRAHGRVRASLRRADSDRRGNARHDDQRDRARGRLPRHEGAGCGAPNGAHRVAMGDGRCANATKMPTPRTIDTFAPLIAITTDEVLTAWHEAKAKLTEEGLEIPNCLLEYDPDLVISEGCVAWGPTWTQGPQVEQRQEGARCRRGDDLLDDQSVGVHRRLPERRASRRHHHRACGARLSPLPDARNTTAAPGNGRMMRAVGFGLLALVAALVVSEQAFAEPVEPTGSSEGERACSATERLVAGGLRSVRSEHRLRGAREPRVHAELQPRRRFR